MANHPSFRRRASHQNSFCQRFYRRPRLENLEERCVLSAPTLAPIADVTVQSGAPLHVALDGFDLDGDSLSFAAISTNSNLTTYIPEGNRSLLMEIEDFGDMVFELFEQRAPNTTARIAELASFGFYDGLIFHRVIEDFMIQSGDPLGTGTGGSGFDFDDEFHYDLQHTGTGMLSMAKSGDDTNDSQFFITAGPTRHLDFNHSIFGQLVEGDDVRQAIAAVPVGGSDKPLEDVVIDMMTVFYDEENGVLMLAAPEGYTGEADVTVTVSDGNGGTAQQTFHVNIVEDTENGNPFMLPMGNLHTDANTPIDFDIFSLDVEGDEIFHDGYVMAPAEDLLLEVSADGFATLTPTNNLAGVHEVFLGIQTPGGSWEDSVADFQSIALLIDPAAPGNIELLPSSDTGLSDSDGITNLNNEDSQNALTFRVSGVVDGAEVTLYADGQQIGLGIAVGDSAVIITDGDFELTDGAHAITAVQVLRDQTIDVGNQFDTVDLESVFSAPVDIFIDTSIPQFTSTPIGTAEEGAEYVYDVETDAEGQGLVEYSLLASPTGMLIDMATGEITWMPQPGQGPSETVVVQVRNTAGNSDWQQFGILIHEAAELEPIDDQAVAEGSLLTFTANVADNDGSLVFSLGSGAPAGAVINASSGVFTWTPTEAEGPGQYLLKVHVADLAGAVATEAFWVNVTEVNTPPVLAPIDDVTIAEGQQLSFTVSVTDEDLPANVMTYELIGGVPAGATIGSTTGRFTYTPSELHGGQSFQITVRVSDSAGATDEQSFTVDVDEVDSPPKFAAVETQVVSPGDELLLLVRAFDPDIPTNAIRYQLEPGAPQGAAIDPETGLLTWSVPTNNGPLNAELVVRATEITAAGPGRSSLAMVHVIVFDSRIAAAAVLLGSEGGSPGSQVPVMQAVAADLSLLALTTSPQPESFQFSFTPVTLPTPESFPGSSLGSLLDPFNGHSTGSVTTREEAGDQPAKDEPSSEEPGARDAAPRATDVSADPQMGSRSEVELPQGDPAEIPEELLELLAESDALLAELMKHSPE